MDVAITDEHNQRLRFGERVQLVDAPEHAGVITGVPPCFPAPWNTCFAVYFDDGSVGLCEPKELERA